VRSLKKTLQRFLQSKLHLAIDSTRPHGRDDCIDIGRSGSSIRVIFDVGAHDGSSSLKFHDAFPSATIHAFEPVRHVFERLTGNVGHIPLVHCHALAMGATPGEATVYLTDHETMSSLIKPEYVRGEEKVRVGTVDEFATNQSIETIDLLKVDAEGYDLEVLRGASRLFGRGAVHFVLAEVGFTRGDRRHVLFDEVRDYLAPFGFHVYGFYDQQREWSGENRLRYANACFAQGV
jgi:FkbM family methyltransferase